MHNGNSVAPRDDWPAIDVSLRNEERAGPGVLTDEQWGVVGTDNAFRRDQRNLASLPVASCAVNKGEVLGNHRLNRGEQ